MFSFFLIMAFLYGMYRVTVHVLESEYGEFEDDKVDAWGPLKLKIREKLPKRGEHEPFFYGEAFVKAGFASIAIGASFVFMDMLLTLEIPATLHAVVIASYFFFLLLFFNYECRRNHVNEIFEDREVANARESMENIGEVLDEWRKNFF